MVSLSKEVTTMNEVPSNQTDDEILYFDIPDAVLETSAGGGDEKANAFTQWMCTAVFFCPGA